MDVFYPIWILSLAAAVTLHAQSDQPISRDRRSAVVYTAAPVKREIATQDILTKDACRPEQLNLLADKTSN